MSCLQALHHLKIDHPIIKEILSKLMSLKASGFDIHLCWLLGQVGIHGNERADRRHSEPTSSPVSSHPLILNQSFASTSLPCGRTRGTRHRLRNPNKPNQTKPSQNHTHH